MKNTPRDTRGRYAKTRFEIEYDLEELQRQEAMVPTSARNRDRRPTPPFICLAKIGI